jgi:hypothetical protein
MITHTSFIVMDARAAPRSRKVGGCPSGPSSEAYFQQCNIKHTLACMQYNIMTTDSSIYTRRVPAHGYNKGQRHFTSYFSCIQRAVQWRGNTHTHAPPLTRPSSLSAGQVNNHENRPGKSCWRRRPATVHAALIVSHQGENIRVWVRIGGFPGLRELSTIRAKMHFSI